MPTPDEIMNVFQEKLGDRAPAYIHSALQQTVLHFLAGGPFLARPLTERFAILEEMRADLYEDAKHDLAKIRSEIAGPLEDVRNLEALLAAMDSCGAAK